MHGCADLALCGLKMSRRRILLPQTIVSNGLRTVSRYRLRGPSVVFPYMSPVIFESSCTLQFMCGTWLVHPYFLRTGRDSIKKFVIKKFRLWILSKVHFLSKKSQTLYFEFGNTKSRLKRLLPTVRICHG